MLIQDKPPNFRGKDGKLYLVRCFACSDSPRGRENYCLAVADGTCAWCGWSEPDPFAPARPTSTTCSARCRNTETARKTAAARGDKLRGRGAGRAKYRKRGGRHEHRVVAEEKLGRSLLPGETVHHRDGDGLNNAEENLEVLASQGEHVLRHPELAQLGVDARRRKRA